MFKLSTRTLLLFLFLILSSFPGASVVQAEEDCGPQYSSVVFVGETGEIISSTRAEEITYPASLVKMMTLYLAFEAIENGKIKPEDKITISARGEEISKINKVNTMHLNEGDKISVREAIRGIIVKSFNEAAVVLAEAVAGDEWNFARKMNEKAIELGMNNSSFRNASGLHDEGQFTTSYDLARLSMAIKKNFSEYYYLFSLKEFSFQGTTYKTHNHVLTDYRGAEGMKTGFTNASGFNLISAAKKNDDRVISVLLGCSSYQKRDQLTKKLLNEAFEKISEIKKQKIGTRVKKAFDYRNYGISKERPERFARVGNGFFNEKKFEHEP